MLSGNACWAQEVWWFVSQENHSIGRVAGRMLKCLRSGDTGSNPGVPCGVAQFFCAASGPYVSGVYKQKIGVNLDLKQEFKTKWRRQKLYKIRYRPYRVPNRTEPTDTYKPYRTRYGEASRLSTGLCHVPRTLWRRQQLYKIRRSYRTPYRTEPADTYKPYRTRCGEATLGRTPIVIA